MSILDRFNIADHTFGLGANALAALDPAVLDRKSLGLTRLISQNFSSFDPIALVQVSAGHTLHAESLLNASRAAEIANFSLLTSDQISAGRFTLDAWIDCHHPSLGFFDHRSHIELASRASEAANLALAMPLPSALSTYRTPFEEMSLRLWGVGDSARWQDENYLLAFSRTSAMADMFDGYGRVERQLINAARQFSSADLPVLGHMADYRAFFDGAGLQLSRWPKIRLLTASDKRRRLKSRLRAHSEAPHLKRAKSLVHRYELMLHEIIDGAMAAEFGEDWPQRRLPLCDCNDLLGKWRKRGGDVLDHADYTHFGRIMGHREHFAAIFEAGFEDPDELTELMERAGRLRASSHHAKRSTQFTPDDLRDLRVVWRTIETGLIALTADYDVEFG